MRCWAGAYVVMGRIGSGGRSGRALHRHTLRRAGLRHQQEGHIAGVTEEVRDCSRLSTQQSERQEREMCPDDVELHSFEVWVPLAALNAIKLLPLTPRRGESDDSMEPRGGEAAAAEAEVSKALASFGVSPRIGEASAKYKDLCLVAGEIGVAIGSVYTSLTAFTDADSAGTAQLAATRLLLRKAGYELMDLGMHLPYKESLGAETLPRAVFLRLFRRLRDRNASSLDATMQECCDAAQAGAKLREAHTEGRTTGAKKSPGDDQGNKSAHVAVEQIMELPVTTMEEMTFSRLTPGFMGCREFLQLVGSSQPADFGSCSSIAPEKRAAMQQRQEFPPTKRK